MGDPHASRHPMPDEPGERRQCGSKQPSADVHSFRNDRDKAIGYRTFGAFLTSTR